MCPVMNDLCKNRGGGRVVYLNNFSRRISVLSCESLRLTFSPCLCVRGENVHGEGMGSACNNQNDLAFLGALGVSAVKAFD